MKITTLLLITAILQVSASTFAQKVTLSEKNAPINKVFDQIRQQTGYDFLVNKSVLKNAAPVNVEVKDIELKDALDKIFADQQLIYEITDQTILVKVKEKSFIDNLIQEFTPPKTIHGLVRDSTGAVLPGATVNLINITGTRDGMGIGLVTDADGNFSVNVAPGKYRLEISYIGYAKYIKEIVVKNNEINLDVHLSSAQTRLQEVAVVNTGYQQLKVEQATGSYNIISKDQLEKPTTDISLRLIGTTAGLQSTNTMSTTGTAGVKFEIRGKSNLNTQTTTAPLFVVDGFPVTSTLAGPTGIVDPNNVESITILKDAAAASIWGARAVNGVIVITTKTAKKGTPLKVEVGAFTRFAPKFDLGYAAGLASSSETVDWEQMIYGKYGNTSVNNSVFNVSQRSSASVALNENFLGYITTAQLNATLAQLKTQDNRQQITDNLLAKPVTTQYNLTLSGSSQKMSNIISLGFQRDQYSFVGNKDQQYHFNYRATANLYKWLDVNVGASAEYVNTPSNGVGISDIKGWSPYNILLNPDGSLANVPKYNGPILNRVFNVANFPYPDFSYNPIQEINNRNILTPEFNTRFQGGLTFKIIRGLSVDLKGQYEYFTRTNSDLENEQTFLTRNTINTSSTVSASGTVTNNLPKGSIFQNQQRNTINKYYWRGQVNYNRSFNDVHEINVIAGTEYSKLITQVYANPNSYGYNDNTLAVGTPNYATSTGWQGNQNFFSFNNSYAYGTQVFYSLFANAAYTYLKKYTFSVSARTDASNLITSDPKYRYRPFGSVGLSYDISKEKFMQNINWIDRLNLRATYGYNGNVDASTSPYTLLALNPTQNAYTNDFTAQIQRLGNPYLRWERTGTLNLGIDYSFFKGRLFGSVEYYDKEGRDLLSNVSLASVNGSTNALFNNASLSNKGIEVVLGSALPIKGNDVAWRGSINAAYNKTRVVNILNTSYAPTSMLTGNNYLTGYDPNTAWAYEYAGLVNGVASVKGANGVAYPVTSIPSTVDGRTFLKNMGTYDQPYLLGMNNSFKVYDFNLSFIVTAKYGGVFKGQAFNFPSSSFGNILPNRQLSNVLNGNPDQILTLPTVTTASLSPLAQVAPNLSYNILNAGVLRMQEINLSYNVPVGLLSRANIKRMLLGLQGNNLFNIYSNKTGQDPEFIYGTLKPVAQYTINLRLDL